MGRGSTFSSEFREQAVELVRATGTTIAEDARDLQINDMTLGNWARPTVQSGASRTAAGCRR